MVKAGEVKSSGSHRLCGLVCESVILSCRQQLAATTQNAFAYVLHKAFGLLISISFQETSSNRHGLR